MAVNLNTFITLANSAFFSSRDIIVEGKDEDQTAKLGHLVISSGKDTNIATMEAFKKALVAEYGFFGAHAFDTVLGTRMQTNKSLRSSEVTSTLSRLETIKGQRFTAELQRQLETDPTLCELSDEVRSKVFKLFQDHPFGDPPAKFDTCQTPEQMNTMVAWTISRATTRAIQEVAQEKGAGAIAGEALGPRQDAAEEIDDKAPTGLKGFTTKPVFTGSTTSVEDHVKAGTIGAGMRVHRSSSNPVLFQKLKTNGVEPGFITSNDWSIDDTRGLMADIWSDDNKAQLDEISSQSSKIQQMLRDNPNVSRREVAMAAGRAFKGGVAAVAEYVLQRDLADPDSSIAKAFKAKCPGIDKSTLFPADGSEPTQQQKDRIALVKRALFTEIRDAVMNETSDSEKAKSPIFQHFADRTIVKLDYNEGDRFAWRRTPGHSGHFRLPERINVKKNVVYGHGYRTTRLSKPDDASTSAVREALANDLTRMLGVPAQELSLVRGEYSDGHPKFLLSAKFASGYKDLEKGYLEDGQVVSPSGLPLPQLGQYKILFLALADRDAVGSHGQNKGIREIDAGNGRKELRFFAIDPGHSLEGNAKHLDIHDDFSFSDAIGTRFKNFSVFDDDTRFSKFQGVLSLRDLSQSEDLTALFTSYRTKFNPNEPGISDAEKELRNTILKNIGTMETEFRSQIDKILTVFKPQLDFYDALDSQGKDVQKKAIETIANLEKLTSPTTWKSKEGKVELKHLAVESGKRIPWKATVSPDGAIVYSTGKTLSKTAQAHLTAFCAQAGVLCSIGKGGVSITVPTAMQDAFFEAFDESRVATATHPQEALERAMAAPPPLPTVPPPPIPDDDDLAPPPPTVPPPPIPDDLAPPPPTEPPPPIPDDDDLA